MRNFVRKALFLSSSVLFAPHSFGQSVPYTFTPGAVIRANELNENFKALSTGGAVSTGGVRMFLENGGSVELGSLLGMDNGLDRVPAMYGLTGKNYQFWIGVVLQNDNTNNGTATRLTFDSRKFTEIVYRNSNCQGTAYIYEFYPDARYYIFNGFVVSDGSKILMMNPGNPITQFAPASRTTQSGGCEPVPLAEPARRYVELRNNDSAISGFPSNIPASGVINIRLQR